MADSPRARMEVEAAMRRIHDLSTSEQLKVFLLLRDYLGDTVGEETAADKQIRERAEALDAMQKVAEYLGLPPGVVLKNAAYKKVPKDVAPGWSATRVGDAWARYRTAERAYRGERVPESPAQRSRRREHSGRTRNEETYFAGLRFWLATRPASTTSKDYDEFVRAHTDRVEAGRVAGPPLVLHNTVSVVPAWAGTTSWLSLAGKLNSSSCNNSAKTSACARMVARSVSLGFELRR